MTHLNHEFCWSELMSSDLHQALRFYETLFGWKHTQNPGLFGNGYNLISHGEQPLAGALVLGEDHRNYKGSSYWKHYVSTPSLEITLSAAETAGGQILVPPTPFRDAGRFAKIQDPGGARMSLWEPKLHRGYQARIDGPLGQPCWFELSCHDLEASKQFYEACFGWEPRKRTHTSLDYWVLYNEDQPMAGLMQSRVATIHLPDEWLMFLHTPNLNKSIEEVRAFHGELRHGPIELEGGGRYAVFGDPAGANFALLQGQPALH